MRLQITELKRPVIDDRNSIDHVYDPEVSRQMQERHETLYAEFLRQWMPPREPIVDEDGCEDTEFGGIRFAAFECWKLRRQGYVAAATAPYYNGAVNEWLAGYEYEKTASGLVCRDTGILSRFDTAVTLTLPFLMKSGEFHVTYETEKRRTSSLEGVETDLVCHKRLRVRTSEQLFSGELIRDCSEIWFEIVKLPKGTPQAVADAVAAAYTAIGKLDLPQDYPAVLPLQGHCAHCHRPLTDPVSKVLGLGPDCAARFRVPHNAAAVNHILDKRQAFLADLATAH